MSGEFKMLCLVFDVEQKMEVAIDKIWVLIVKDRARQGDNMVGDYTTHYTDLSNLTDSVIAKLKTYGTKNGTVNRENGATENWDEGKKIYQQDRWYIKKPDDAFMTDVVGYNLEDFNDNWVETQEV